MIPARYFAKGVVMSLVLRFLIDALIGLLIAIVIGVPVYIAYVRGYSDGEHDRARWLHEHDDCDARLHERSAHDAEWLAHVRSFYEQHCALDGGAP